MAVQSNAGEARKSQEMGVTCPDPVSLETMELIEQALAEMLSSLRRKITSRESLDAGAIEYESWGHRQH